MPSDSRGNSLYTSTSAHSMRRSDGEVGEIAHLYGKFRVPMGGHVRSPKGTFYAMGGELAVTKRLKCVGCLWMAK